MKKDFKNQTGITLVALVITIIVLLILAIVSVKILTDSSIIGHANNAVTKYGAAQSTEETSIADAEIKMDTYASKIGGSSSEQSGQAFPFEAGATANTVRLNSHPTFVSTYLSNYGDFDNCPEVESNEGLLQIVYYASNGNTYLDFIVFGQDDVHLAHYFYNFSNTNVTLTLEVSKDVEEEKTLAPGWNQLNLTTHEVTSLTEMPTFTNVSVESHSNEKFPVMYPDVLLKIN